MKPNPPETAPMDGTVFLACLNRASQDYPAGTCFRWEFVPAFYDPDNGFLFGYADIVVSDSGMDDFRVFFTENCDRYNFIGWLPIPKFDGNRVLF